ncbi:hypothetical protein V8B97DRAFT_2024613 [Scleroderma yunnanense]
MSPPCLSELKYHLGNTKSDCPHLLTACRTGKWEPPQRITTLNIRGRFSPTTGPGPISKWTAVTKALCSQQIGILALQETHLPDSLAAQINQLHSQHILLLNFPNPNTPGSLAGVAFVIKQEKIDIKNATLTNLISGKAIAIMMMRDYNIVEDPLDQASARSDNNPAVNALCTCRQTLNVQDFWCQAFPSEHLFTYSSLSNWVSTTCEIPSDHKITLVQLTPLNDPYIGKGHCLEPQQKIDNPPQDDRSTNPQTLWQQFKDNIKKEASKAVRSQILKITQWISTLRKDTAIMYSLPSLDTKEALSTNVIALE